MSAVQRVIAEKGRQAEEDETQWQRLQRQIAEKTRQEDGDNKTWQRARYEAARKATANGTFKEPEIPFPFIITPDGPISSAKKLPRLAEMESVSEALETTLVRKKWASTAKPVTIRHNNFAERGKLEEKANVEHDVSRKFMVLFRGQRKHAIVVGP
ncbi:hypothetical protein VTI74DRAFT_8026 [Chaetomium olivicolor]